MPTMRVAPAGWIPVEPAEIEGAVVGAEAVVVAYGQTDGLSASRLDAVLEALVAQRPSRLTVDLSEVIEVDEAVLEVVARQTLAVPSLQLRLPRAERSGFGGRPRL